MDFLSYILSIALTAFVIWRVAVALSRGETPHGEAEPALVDRKERLVQGLKDLELDHLTGRLPAGDYQEGKNSASLELAAVLKEIDNVGNV